MILGSCKPKTTSTNLSTISLQADTLNIQQKSTREFYDETFHWKVTIPGNMKTVNPEKWKKSNEVGLQMIEDTYNEEVKDNTIPICIFTNGEVNIFEAKYQLFNPEVDGTSLKVTQTVHEVIYTILNFLMLWLIR